MKDIRLDTASHNSILARLERLETKLDALQNSGVQAATLDEISDDLGIIRSGGFWATTSEGDPTSSGWTGVFIDGGGYTFGTTVYPFGGVQNGTLQFGGAYTNGKFMAGGGAVTLDADGIGIAPGTTKTDANAYKFRNSGGTTVGGLSGQVLSGYSTNCMTLESIGNADEQVAQIRLTATHNDTSEVDLNLNTDGGNAVFTVEADDVSIIATDDVFVWATTALSLNYTTITFNGNAPSDTYTPTLYNTTNVATSTPYSCQWGRSGNFITVTGRVDIDVTSGGGANTVLGVELPVASNLAANNQLGGVASTRGSESAAILGDATNDRALIQFAAVATANTAWWFTFSYRVA